MKSSLIYLIIVEAHFVFWCRVEAWNKQIFDRYTRNLFRNGELDTAKQDRLKNFANFFGIGSDASRAAEMISHDGNAQVAKDTINGFRHQPEPEVYGIVEPLIEDFPCVDRPCSVNDDCCLNGVCFLSYGGLGKCNYDFRYNQDRCRSDADCEHGLSCLKGTMGYFLCQPANTLWPVTKLLALKQLGEDCETSADCNVNRFICCQLDRTHHGVLPRKKCAFFRDPFLCVDLLQQEHESRTKHVI